MTRRLLVAAGVAVGGMLAATTGMSAQMKNTALPRAPDGHPDLTGTYDLAMLTPLERPAGMPAVMSDEEAAKLEKRAADQNRALDRNIDGNRAAPPKGGDGSVGPAGN
ncbi:MAG TPA: hypothetical protein VF219_05335, partial [Vicinamibacterales bacterium]